MGSSPMLGVALGFPGDSDSKNLPVIQEIPGSGRCLREGNGNLLQYSCLGNPRDRELQSLGLQRVKHN